ncbi:MAG: cytochrome b [Ramlibacter sp.]
MTADNGARYGRMDVFLHWFIGIALLAEIAFGFLLDDIAPRGTPARTGVINLHKSVGVVLGVLIAARLLWRMRHPAPPWPASVPAWQQRAAHWMHRALGACMVIMPLGGYLGSNFSKYGVRFFGLALAPWGPDLPGVYSFFIAVHDITAYVFTALIAVHVGAAVKHALVDRDAVFSRMLPRGWAGRYGRWRTGDPARKGHA